MTRACGASNVTGPLTKWQLALAVATPVALGFGYMYYKNNRKPSSKPSRGKPKNSSKENGAPTSDKQISIDVDCPPTKIISEPETSLEKAQRYKNEGNDHFKMGKFDEAIAQYNIAIEVCPKENEEALATFYQNRAAAYEQLKKYSAVKADCTKAIELKPRYAKALHRRARVFELCNKLEAALEDLTTARISKSFSDESTITMSDRILNQLSRQNAIEYLANKTLIMPSQFFIKTYIAGFPSDPVFSMLKETDYSNISPGFAKVLQCVKEERYDDVIPLCTEEINSSEPDTLPDKMKVLLLRATFYLLLGHGAAIEDLGTIIDSDTASKSIKANALIKRASLFMQSENPDKSFCDFETAVELDPDCCDIYQCRGQVNLLMDKVSEAREDFKKAFELNPFFKVAYVQKCYADYRYGLAKGDEELITEGIKNCKKAFKKFPDCPECYILYAQILSEMRTYEKADIYFAKACEKDPHNATVYVHRGLLQLQGYGDVEKAIEYINKALEIDDKCESAYETLGLIEVQRGNFTEAIKLFDKALPLGRTVVELTHIFSLQNAVKIQYTVRDRLDSEQL